MRGDSFLGRMANASRDRVSLARARESEAALRARATTVADAPTLRLGEFVHRLGILAQFSRIF